MARDRASRPEAASRRLFMAVEIPDEVKRIVDEAVEPWRLAFPRARWVPLGNWHVTLKFLGATWPRLHEWVLGAVEGVARSHVPVRARLHGLGAFPSATRARVLWAGVDDPTGGLGSIAADLDTALAEEFRVEMHAFHAHLTVARSEPPLRLPPEYGATTLLTEAFSIERLVVFQSHLRRPASLYEPIAVFPLSG
jgi:2'-5' RNA ligase